MSSLTLAHAMPAARQRNAFKMIVRNEARIAMRRPVALIGGVAVPLVLLVIFGKVPVFRQPAASLGGQSYFDQYVPILMAFGIAMLALMGLPIPLVTSRQLGVLRRLSTTPVPPSWLLAAQAVVQASAAVALVAIVLVLTIVGYHMPAPVSPAGLALSLVLTIAALFSIGLMVAARVPTSGAANVTGRLLFFPLMFFAGLWLPRALMPPMLRDISNYTPLGAAVQALQSSMQQGFPSIAPLLVLAGYAVVFSFLAKRFFRWE
jgi:ABC-2 type transport system permease protein